MCCRRIESSGDIDCFGRLHDLFAKIARQFGRCTKVDWQLQQGAEFILHLGKREVADARTCFKLDEEVNIAIDGLIAPLNGSEEGQPRNLVALGEFGDRFLVVRESAHNR